VKELAKVKTNTEVFSRKPDRQQEAEYKKWKNLTTWLKSSKRSFLAE
jgi:hypothetical protein